MSRQGIWLHLKIGLSEKNLLPLVYSKFWWLYVYGLHYMFYIIKSYYVGNLRFFCQRLLVYSSGNIISTHRGRVSPHGRELLHLIHSLCLSWFLTFQKKDNFTMTILKWPLPAWIPVRTELSFDVIWRALSLCKIDWQVGDPSGRCELPQCWHSVGGLLDCKWPVIWVSTMING